MYNILVKLELNLIKYMEHLVSVSYSAPLQAYDQNITYGKVKVYKILYQCTLPYDSDKCLSLRLMTYTYGRGL